MPLQDEVAYLRIFHRLGLRSLGLTHNWRNSLADGCNEVSGGGLTHFGLDVVKECNRLGIVVDVAHLSDKGIEHVLKVSTHPIVASHSNARAVYNIRRNLPDELIQGIAQAGGVIGFHAANFLVMDQPNPTMEHLLRHILHVAEVGGIDCVGVGLDLMEEWHEFNLRAMEGAPRYAGVPAKPGPPFEYPAGMQSVGDLPNVTAALMSSGWSEEAVTKFLGGNFLRVYEKVWGPASRR